MKTPRLWANIAIFYDWEPTDAEIDNLVSALNDVESNIIGWSPAPDETEEDSTAIYLYSQNIVPDGAELCVDRETVFQGRDWEFIVEIDDDELLEVLA